MLRSRTVLQCSLLHNQQTTQSMQPHPLRTITNRRVLFIVGISIPSEHGIKTGTLERLFGAHRNGTEMLGSRFSGFVPIPDGRDSSLYSYPQLLAPRIFCC